MKDSIFGFQATRVGTGMESTLSLSGAEQQLSHLLQFQLNMLINNRIPGLATMKVKQRDLQVSLVYLIGGRVTLADYLSSKPIVLAELGELLERMVQPVRECKNYFLHDEGFVMDADYIFLNPLFLRTLLIYVPVSPPKEPMTGYQRIVETVLTKLGVEKEGCFENLEGETNLDKFLNFARLLSSEGFNHKVMIQPADKVIKIPQRCTGKKRIIVVDAENQ